MDDKKDNTGICAHHNALNESLKILHEKLDTILVKLGEEYANIKVLETKMITLERLVYGAAGVGGGAMIIAVVNFVTDAGK